MLKLKDNPPAIYPPFDYSDPSASEMGQIQLHPNNSKNREGEGNKPNLWANHCLEAW